ncbi:hypothetical protein CSUB01_08440 [Colletotrichum sublineola]|uniref:Uncharacterized protein n=1 Tax=Colletotrichum sublineola TaxID=1173701 RepID=A0A066XZ63_COLSU|nr:hypothetical protein CSUB01_08440 [Colletotrichum sublineola]
MDGGGPILGTEILQFAFGFRTAATCTRTSSRHTRLGIATHTHKLLRGGLPTVFAPLPRALVPPVALDQVCPVGGQRPENADAAKVAHRPAPAHALGDHDAHLGMQHAQRQEAPEEPPEGPAVAPVELHQRREHERHRHVLGKVGVRPRREVQLVGVVRLAVSPALRRVLSQVVLVLEPLAHHPQAEERVVHRERERKRARHRWFVE